MRFSLVILLTALTYSGDCLPFNHKAVKFVSVASKENIQPLLYDFKDDAMFQQKSSRLDVEAFRLTLKAATKACCATNAIDPKGKGEEGFIYLRQFASFVKYLLGFLDNYEYNNVDSLKKPTADLIDCLTTNNYQIPEPERTDFGELKPYSNTGSAYFDTRYRGGHY